MGLDPAPFATAPFCPSGARQHRRAGGRAVVAARRALRRPGPAGGRRLHGSGQLGDRHPGPRLGVRLLAAVRRAALQPRRHRAAGAGAAPGHRGAHGPGAGLPRALRPAPRAARVVADGGSPSSRATSPRCWAARWRCTCCSAVSLALGIVVTAFDTLLVLGLKGKGFRQVGGHRAGPGDDDRHACFAIELALVGPDWHAVSGRLRAARRRPARPARPLHRHRHPRRHA